MFATLIVRASDKAPEPNDVVAGWTGFALFVGLIVGVVVIAFFLVRSLRRVDRSEELGRYDHKPGDPRATRSTDAGGDPAEPTD